MDKLVLLQCFTAAASTVSLMLSLYKVGSGSEGLATMNNLYEQWNQLNNQLKSHTDALKGAHEALKSARDSLSAHASELKKLTEKTKETNGNGTNNTANTNRTRRIEAPITVTPEVVGEPKK